LEFSLLTVTYQIKHAKELYFGKKIAVKFLGFWF
jgi:Golgi nucleoside diphosphatase